MLLGLVPLIDDLVAEFLVEWEAISVGMDDAFEGLWVVEWFDQLLIVPHKVVVELQASRFFLVDDNFTDLQEDTCHLGVLGVKRGGALDAA